MKRNDYFVIVYRILTYLYECFQAGESANLDMISAEALKINDGYWTNVIESMLREGYIVGITLVPRGKISALKIIQKGIEYLQEDYMMEKAKNVLKEINEIIPGL